MYLIIATVQDTEQS